MKAGHLHLSLILVCLAFLCNTAFAGATNPTWPGVAEANRLPSMHEVSPAPVAVRMSDGDSTAGPRPLGQIEQATLAREITTDGKDLDASQAKIQATSAEFPAAPPAQSNPSGCIQTLHL
jgi:hypothetical protein